MSKPTVQGVKMLKHAFKRRHGQTLAGLRTGLYRAGLFLQRESQVICPVEYGNLHNSANTRDAGTDARPLVMVSYGTDYAIYVHENLEARHTPGKTAKFLETPLRTKQAAMRALVEGGIRGGLP